MRKKKILELGIGLFKTQAPYNMAQMNSEKRETWTVANFSSGSLHYSKKFGKIHKLFYRWEFSNEIWTKASTS